MSTQDQATVDYIVWLKWINDTEGLLPTIVLPFGDIHFDTLSTAELPILWFIFNAANLQEIIFESSILGLSDV
jgi:hypothetical protein